MSRQATLRRKLFILVFAGSRKGAKTQRKNEPQIRCAFASLREVSLRYLELEPESELTLTARQHLSLLAEVRIGAHGKDRGGVLTIQKVKELKHHLQFESLGEVDSLRETHVEIRKRRRRESISSRNEIDPRQGAIAVGIRCGSGATVMKATLRAKDAAELNLPGQLDQTVDLESMID